MCTDCRWNHSCTDRERRLLKVSSMIYYRIHLSAGYIGMYVMCVWSPLSAELASQISRGVRFYPTHHLHRNQDLAFCQLWGYASVDLIRAPSWCKFQRVSRRFQKASKKVLLEVSVSRSFLASKIMYDRLLDISKTTWLHAMFEKDYSFGTLIGAP